MFQITVVDHKKFNVKFQVPVFVQRAAVFRKSIRPISALPDVKFILEPRKIK
jgi:hypothetical protein